jgi:prepilin-type N-terminal cleavage/methylation domain-containing protein/prepilin-type processing-associated H-X9-DG protein
MSQARHIGRRRPHVRGFTLIEILVVVAIIALLVAILLPSLARAREQSREVICKANAHQMAIALNLYTIEHRYFPGHHTVKSSINPVSTRYALWPVRLLKYLNKQNQVYWCPSAPATTRWNGRDRIRVDGVPGPGEVIRFSYGYNDWGVKEFTNPHLGLGAHIFDDNREYAELRVDRVKRPSEMITIADNNSEFNPGSPSYDTALDPYEGSEVPGQRHRKGANVVFPDGHASWYTQKAIKEPAKGMRQRWNNDFRNHCSVWWDKPAGMPCTNSE